MFDFNILLLWKGILVLYWKEKKEMTGAFTFIWKAKIV